MALVLRGNKRKVCRVVCVACARELPEGASFCPICGARQALPSCAVCGAELAAGHGHTSAVMAVAVAPAGEIAASAGVDQSIRLWKLPG